MSFEHTSAAAPLMQYTAASKLLLMRLRWTQRRAPYEAYTPEPLQAEMTQSEMSHEPLLLQSTPWLPQADRDVESSVTRSVLEKLTPHKTELTILHPMR
jgi:hypothetical protein